MKIECDKCGAKYAIADEKVRGKTFKIRCKKCSNVIIVRDKAAGDEAAEPEQAPEDDASGWHLAIGGGTVGPISEQDVRDRFAAGEIDGSTSVWQEGFDDWLPLSSVDAFADLAAAPSEPEPAAAVGGVAAAADPFAGSSDDDFGGGFSEPEPESEPEFDQGHSPRVDDLTGARNENSVLFSLDSLSAVALGGGGGGGAAASQQPVSSGPSFSVAPASTAPSQTTAQGEGSGLIDIRAMSAMLGDSDGGGDGGGGGESFGEAAIPSFGGGFGGLAAAPLSIDSPESEAVVVAPEPVRSSNGPLYALIGVLAIGLIAVAGYVVTRPPPEGKTTEIIKVVPGQVPMDDDGEGRKKKKKKNDEDEDEDDEDDDESSADDAGSGTKKTKKTSTRKKSSGSSAAASASDKPADSGTKEAAPKPEEKKPDDVSVDCLLDPSKCKKAGSSSKPSGGGGSSAPPDSSLPAKLTAADIKSGYASAKTAAQNNCKSKAKGGEKVSVKLSIEGSSGKVVSATSDGTPLGTCVANELKKASFKKFQAAQQGVQVSLRF